MNKILYENRCKCNEEISVIKKRKSISKSEGKPLQYPKSNEITSKTFQIKYENNLSLTEKLILNSFHNKYIYYAIDDILYLLKSNPIERDNLLAVLYSPILFLHNNLSINFFDIWIRDIFIEERKNVKTFLNDEYSKTNESTFIKIKLFYRTRVPSKKQESLW